MGAFNSTDDSNTQGHLAVKKCFACKNKVFETTYNMGAPAKNQILEVSIKQVCDVKDNFTCKYVPKAQAGPAQ